MSVLENSQTIEISPETEQESLPYIGKWNELISTSNWKKGEIISAWRKSLQEKSARSTEYSDEAWSQLVGGVTPQHTGRLRRTFERFGSAASEFEGLFWSHFYAALDWEDAEMWLEGAVQNKWSVSRMRKQRWEVLGSLPDQQPRESDVLATEMVEENHSLELTEKKRQNDRNEVTGPVYEGPDFGDQDFSESGNSAANLSGTDPRQDFRRDTGVVEQQNHEPLFESFENLPDDVLEGVNAFKLLIIRHRTEQWQEISQQDMINLLEALKKMASRI
jgi:hypothetical protein